MPRPIVGIGASAGGVDTLRHFFATLPEDTGMAFVVVLHLSPDYESNLPSILGQDTTLTVREAENRADLAPDHVYVIPPRTSLTIEDGRLHLTDTEGRHNVSTIDRFFRSLATDQGDNAVGIVLSGTGSDGTIGLRDIKEQGGVTMVQDPAEAEYHSMPQSAIASGLIDLVLPVRKLAEKLVEYRNKAGSIQLPERLEALDEDDKSTLQKIFTRLYTATGHDFTNYKRTTVLRRLERRLQLQAKPSLDAYLALLREDKGEAQSLYKDLLISVTNFFRDPDAFSALEKSVIPKLFEGKEVGDQVRVWVPGCATGEEAYSIAILLAEYAGTLDYSPDLQVFATDVDEEALSVGREAVYPEPIQSDVTPERLKQFFDHEGDFYHVKSHIRDIVLFARQDLLSDPPFSSLDLVSCRNLLIYLNREMQEHVFNLVHYALNESGYLFLGRSEAVGRATHLFSMTDKANNILQARALPDDRNSHVPLPADQWRSSDVNQRSSSDQATDPQTTAHDERSIAEDIHQRALLNKAASVLVNENREIVHISNAASRYLSYAGGTPSHDLLDCVPAELRPELRSALYQALNKNSRVDRTHLQATIQGEPLWVNMRVDPILETSSQSYAVVRFEEVPDFDSVEPTESDDAPEPELQRELERTREQLQSTTEEYEAATEEMEAANEELLSMNEELQSKNEELETSKEELQSVNEELKTTNQELKTKIEELRDANSMLENLMAATDIATLFLDSDLEIQRFTPQITELFNIKPVDVGRPLSDFTQRFEYENLLEDARTVLNNLVKIEREIHQSDSKFFLARLRPYRTVQDTVEGVVLTFVDITNRRELEHELVNASEKVRRQIGQDMHDVLSSDLAALTMKIGTLRDRFESKGIEEADELEEIAQMARKGANQARTLSHALVPVALQEESLAFALENLCREQQQLSGLHITFEGDHSETLPLNKETATHLYRIVHEALINAERHGNADHVSVELWRQNEHLVLTVEDDGVGIPEEVDFSDGLGLRTMNYRATLIGATLTVESVEDGGTVVECKLPMDQARKE